MLRLLRHPIRTKTVEHTGDRWELMQNPKTHLYMCGLKGMESGMEESFGPVG